MVVAFGGVCNWKVVEGDEGCSERRSQKNYQSTRTNLARDQGRIT